MCSDFGTVDDGFKLWWKRCCERMSSWDIEVFEVKVISVRGGEINLSTVKDEIALKTQIEVVVTANFD